MVAQASKILLSTYSSIVTTITQILGTGIQTSITVTATSGSSPYAITCNSTATLIPGQIIIFNGSLGVLVAGTKYYINAILSTTTFNVSTSAGGAVFTLTAASGSITGSSSSIGYGQSLNVANPTSSITITVTATSPTSITCNDTSKLVSGKPIFFSGSLGGLTAGTIYYVSSVLSSTTFTVSTTSGGSVLALSSAFGSITGYYIFKISQASWAAVYTDLTRISTHQGTILSPSIAAPTVGGKITTTAITNFQTAATTVSSPANLYNLASGQYSDTTIQTSTRTTQWNQEVDHYLTVDFGSAANARYFFNSGGSIRISGAKTGSDANSDDTDWKTNILGAMGTITFNYTGAAGTTGTGSSIGWYDLTNSAQQIFLKSGSSYTAN